MNTINLRKRTMQSGNVSLYLAITRNGKREYEYLKLYLVPELTKADKKKNDETMKLQAIASPLSTTKSIAPTDIDIEYCEQVEEMGTDNTIIQFKHLDAVHKALCMKHVGPYERFHESFSEAFAYMEEQGYKIARPLRTSYIDGAWNKEGQNNGYR